MYNKLFYLTKVFSILVFFAFSASNVYGEEENTQSVLQQLQILQKDIKTLEKAVYNQSSIGTSSGEQISNNNDVLTQHLLKLSDLEEQFQILTNSFEEINFKLNKLSSRITKVQTDNQMRFQDLERQGISQSESIVSTEKKELPGSTQEQDLGSISDSDVTTTQQVQKTQSIESAGTVVTETTERTEKILPETTPDEQYKFAISFLKVGDYETAEFALKEFVDSNSKHELAGNAQYWYGETFRIRQLYQDAATAYLDGYQNIQKALRHQ